MKVSRPPIHTNHSGLTFLTRQVVRRDSQRRTGRRKGKNTSNGLIKIYVENGNRACHSLLLAGNHRYFVSVSQQEADGLRQSQSPSPGIKVEDLTRTTAWRDDDDDDYLSPRAIYSRSEHGRR